MNTVGIARKSGFFPFSAGSGSLRHDAHREKRVDSGGTGRRDQRTGDFTMNKYLRPALLSLSLLATVAALPALADDRWDGNRWNDYRGHRYEYAPSAYRPVLSEDQVRWRLRNQGFHRIYDIDRHQNRYTARGRDSYGRPVTVVVSAHTGAILNVYHR
jgi:hypothetical protein